MKYLVFAIVALATPLSAAPSTIKIAAVVNGQPITTWEVERKLAHAESMLEARYPRRGEQFRRALNEARTEVLDQIIEHKLILGNLEEKKLQIPDYVVKQEVAHFIRNNFNGKDEEFRKFLKESKITRRYFEQTQQEKILVQAFKREQFQDVAPATEAEIKKHYRERASDLRDRTKDKITFRKIYIPAVDKNNLIATEEDQLALAEKLALDVNGGADFATIAKAHSSGAFADDGGFWEDTLRVDLEIGFADIIFDTPIGKIVGPIKEKHGFTIVQVVKINKGPAPGLDDQMRERMRTEVQIEKQSARYDRWIEILKRTADIKRKI